MRSDLKKAKAQTAMAARPSANQTTQKKEEEEEVHEEEEMNFSNSTSSSLLSLHLFIKYQDKSMWKVT